MKHSFLIDFDYKGPLRALEKSKKEAKDQESIQSSTTHDPGYQWENDNFTIRHHKREPRGQPFPSRYHKLKIKVDRDVPIGSRDHYTFPYVIKTPFSRHMLDGTIYTHRRQTIINFRPHIYCLTDECSVTLPRGAVGWSAVCDCGIS